VFFLIFAQSPPILSQSFDGAMTKSQLLTYLLGRLLLHWATERQHWTSDEDLQRTLVPLDSFPPLNCQNQPNLRCHIWAISYHLMQRHHLLHSPQSYRLWNRYSFLVYDHYQLFPDPSQLPSDTPRLPDSLSGHSWSTHKEHLEEHFCSLQ